MTHSESKLQHAGDVVASCAVLSPASGQRFSGRHGEREPCSPSALLCCRVARALPRQVRSTWANIVSRNTKLTVAGIPEYKSFLVDAWDQDKAVEMSKADFKVLASMYVMVLNMCSALSAAMGEEEWNNNEVTKSAASESHLGSRWHIRSASATLQFRPKLFHARFPSPECSESFQSRFSSPECSECSFWILSCPWGPRVASRRRQ